MKTKRMLIVSVMCIVLGLCQFAWAASALDFDGVDDYVALPDNNPIWLPQEDFTLSCWVYFHEDATTTNEFILDLNFSQSGDYYNRLGYGLVRVASGNIAFRMISGDGVEEYLDSVTIAGKQRWYHVIAVRDGTTQTLYIDNNLDNSRTCSATPVDFVGNYDNDEVNIGRYSRNGSPFDWHTNGLIDEAAIYDRALTETEIEDIYHNGVFADANLVGYWDFEEGSGQVAGDGSSNGNDGQLGSTSLVDSSDPLWTSYLERDRYLVSHWKLDETGGTIAEDSVGDNNGVVNGATWDDGKIDGALYFNGVSDYVDIPYDSSLDINPSDGITVSVWIKLDSYPPENEQAPIFGLFTGYDAKNFLTLTKNSHEILWFQYPPTDGDLSSIKPDLDKWYHISVVQNATYRAIYINGVLDSSDNNPESYSGDPPDTIRIGNWSLPNYHFHGVIDDVRIYNTALMAEEIREIYEEAVMTYHVDGAGGSNGNDGLTRETAFATIQYGIDTAEDGDTVLVWPGVYNESLFFLNKGITVKSADDAAVLEAVGVGVYCAQLYTLEGPDTVIKNFVIRNSDTGIFVSSGSPTLENLTIVDNGIGIDCYSGAMPSISNCIFWNNSSDLWNCSADFSFVPEEMNMPIAYWKLDGDANDSVGTNHGTIYGATPTIGQIGDALDFNGVSDYVETVVINPDYVSVSAWIKLSGRDGLQCCIGNWEAGGYGLSYNYSDNKKFHFSAYINGAYRSVFSNATVQLDRWYHFVGTYDGDNGYMYIDGTKQTDSFAVSGTISNPVDPVIIGAQPHLGGIANFFNGIIDEVTIYDVALTEEEIQGIYQAGLNKHTLDPSFADPANDDYHLLSERGRYWPAHDIWVLDRASSPCVDGGDPAMTPTGEPMPNGGRINMGAYGGTSYASMSEWPLEGDLNKDGVVDGKDLAMFALEWAEALPWY